MLYLTVAELHNSEIGGILALRQGFGFTLAVTAMYAISNLQGVAYGEKKPPSELALIRRVGDKMSIKIGGLSALALLVLGFIPSTGRASDERLVRDFFITYTLGAIPALGVIVRQENILSAGQTWVLAGLNILSLMIMGSLSFALTKGLGGVGLGLGFSVSTCLSLLCFEGFLSVNKKHQNAFFNRRSDSPNRRPFSQGRSDSEFVVKITKELWEKGLHSGLLYFGTMIGFWSTLLVPFMKNAKTNNVVNGALNQFFFFLIVIAMQIVQVLNANFIAKPFGQMKSVKLLTPEGFSLDEAKNRLKHQISVVLLISLLWPALLIGLLPLFKAPAMKFLTRNTPDHYALVLAATNEALPFVASSGIVMNLTTLFFTIKRTLNGVSRWDSALQISAGILSALAITGLIFGLNLESMRTFWAILLGVNYLIPLIGAGMLTYRHVEGMTADDFGSSDQILMLTVSSTPSPDTQRLVSTPGRQEQGLLNTASASGGPRPSPDLITLDVNNPDERGSPPACFGELNRRLVFEIQPDLPLNVLTTDPT
jgi:hypothetical protein